MEKLSFRVKKEFCAECSLALRRFVGHLDGVKDVEVSVGDGKVTISYDGEKMAGGDLFKISKESIEKLGYGLEDEEETRDG
ncbi:MAG: heavy-metal-associated domain-containing protein [Nitrospirota bacterium]|jgi:copper chaperone CopZ